MRSNTIRRAWVDLLSKSKHVKISLTVGTIAQFICTVLCSAYYIASESNQVCLWLPYVLNTTKSRLFFPILLQAAWQWACGDVCSAVYRYYFCTNCTNTQCLLPALKGEGRFASILIGCAKTDGPITGNITGPFCILLLANTTWPIVVLHDRLAIKSILDQTSLLHECNGWCIKLWDITSLGVCKLWDSLMSPHASVQAIDQSHR